METSLIIQLLTFSGIVIVFLTLKNLLPSYFSEKGKNLATREDITEITTLVETVKQTFTTETEILKSRLNLLSNVQLGIISEERNAIISYNEKYFTWLNALMDLNFITLSPEKNSEIESQQAKIRECYLNFLNAGTIFQLFVEDEKIVELGNKIKLETLKKVQPISRNYLLEIQHNNELYLHEINNNPIELHSIKYNEFRNNKDRIIDKFNPEIFSGYTSLIPETKNFQKKCRERIHVLFQEQNNTL